MIEEMCGVIEERAQSSKEFESFTESKNTYLEEKRKLTESCWGMTFADFEFFLKSKLQ